MRDYLFVEGEFSREIIVNRSRFIATAAGTADSAEADTFIKQTAKKYGGATHNCYAYVLGADGGEQKFSDDGEPQGTAGMPILEVIKKKNLFCTTVVVTRYFGGVKLGAAGLAAAYAKAAAQVLDNAEIRLNRYSDIIQVECGYNHFNLLENRLRQLDAEAIEIFFGSGVTLTAAVPQAKTEEFALRITELTSGEAEIEIKDKRYYSYQINFRGEA